MNAADDCSWKRKFALAWRGVKLGIHGQKSFAVHFGVTGLVILAAAALGASLIEWCVLALCIQAVLTAELFNSALESLAKGVTDEHCPHVGAALDIAGGAVLVAAIAASLVGAAIFIHRVGVLLLWWESAV